jgi:hypothetical protein
MYKIQFLIEFLSDLNLFYLPNVIIASFKKDVNLIRNSVNNKINIKFEF